MPSFFRRDRKEPTPQLSIRDVLFADDTLEHMATHSDGSSDDQPWCYFTTAQQALNKGNRNIALIELKKILSLPELESRVYLQAWHCLRTLGEFPPPDSAHTIRGVVVEVALAQGLDLVAAYSDHSARYFNYSGAGIVWDVRDPEIDRLIDELLALGQNIVRQTGPWNKPRPPAPPQGNVRLNLLTFGGLHFGQADLDVMAQDPIGSAALRAAFNLMQALIARQQKAQHKSV